MRTSSAHDGGKASDEDTNRSACLAAGNDRHALSYALPFGSSNHQPSAARASLGADQAHHSSPILLGLLEGWVYAGQSAWLPRFAIVWGLLAFVVVLWTGTKRLPWYGWLVFLSVAVVAVPIVLRVWLFVYQWKALDECTTGIRWFALWAGNIAISGPVFIMVPAAVAYGVLVGLQLTQKQPKGLEPLSTVTALYLSVLALGLGIAGLLAWSGCGKPAVGVESTVRVIGWIEAAAGLAIAAVSLPFLRPSKWEKWSEAGCLAVAAILMSIIGTVVGLALIVGGAWRALALPAIDRAQLVPVVGAVAAPVVLIVVLMAGGRGRPRWRR